MGCPDIIPTLRTQHCHKMGKKGVKWGVFFPSDVNVTPGQANHPTNMPSAGDPVKGIAGHGS